MTIDTPTRLTRECLLEPLQKVIGVVEKKQTMPILSNVLMSIKDSRISFVGTDSEVELMGESLLIDAANIPDMSITLPGRKLADICRALPNNAAIEMTHEQGQIILRSGKSRFTLSTLPPEDFPTIEHKKTHCEFTIAQNSLKSLLQQVQSFMAHQDVRYYLNGLLLTNDNGTLTAVATDGHRLAKAWLPQSNIQEDLHIIIPRKGALELLRLLSDSDDTVTVRAGQNYITIAGESFTFISRLVEGRFPDFNRVIPKKLPMNIQFDRDELKESLQRVMILCNDKCKNIRFEFSHNALRLTVNNHQLESAEEHLHIDFDNEPFNIGFNIKYLLDALHTTPTGDIRLSLNGPDHSVLVESAMEHSHGVQSLFVIMPMRL